MEKSQMLLADQFEAWRLVAGQQQGFESLDGWHLLSSWGFT
jgi:hypothetical protein